MGGTPSVTVRMLGPLVLLAALGACQPSGQPVQPQILALNYGVLATPLPGLATPRAVIDAVASGQADVGDLLGADPCNFTANFAVTPPPQISMNGTPGNVGFSISIVSTNPVNINSQNAANCRVLDEYTLFLGGPPDSLGVGGTTNQTSASVSFTDGSIFDTGGGHLEATLSGFDANTRYSSGAIRIVADQVATASNRVLVIEGSYAVTP
ncbi:MAG: hypothetical protein AAFX81_00090 [Pseudomonadota bacterium]